MKARLHQGQIRQLCWRKRSHRATRYCYIAPKSGHGELGKIDTYPYNWVKFCKYLAVWPAQCSFRNSTKTLTMKKLFLTLLTMPTSVGLFLPLSSHAAQLQNRGTTLCLDQHNKKYCVTQARPNVQLAMKAKAIGSDFNAGINFTDEESDAAIKKFGCDCPACIRAIKQIKVFTSTT